MYGVEGPCVNDDAASFEFIIVNCRRDGACNQLILSDFNLLAMAAFKL